MKFFANLMIVSGFWMLMIFAVRLGTLWDNSKESAALSWITAVVLIMTAVMMTAREKGLL